MYLLYWFTTYFDCFQWADLLTLLASYALFDVFFLKQSKVIVALVPDLNTPFFLNVVQGIEEIAKSKGFFTMVFSSSDSSEEEFAFINGTMGRSVDGAIVIPSTPDLLFYKDYSKPIVFVDRFNSDYSFDSVLIDNFRGAYIAVEHLIKTGHRKIAIITGPKELNIGQERYWGFDQAMKENNIKINDSYIRICSWTEADGYRSSKELLALDNPPTAIFAANENICRGILKATSISPKAFYLFDNGFKIIKAYGIWNGMVG